MLKLIQKVISFPPSDLTTGKEWSDNILPPGTVAYELTIMSDVGNKFALDESKEPFTIEAAQDGSGFAIPLPIYRHTVPAESLHVHLNNTYKMSTIINILILVDEKNLDQWLDEVSGFSEELESLTKKVEAMYGTTFGVEDYNLGDRLLFLENQVNPKQWSDSNYNLSMAAVISQGLIYDDTYLTEEV